MLSTLAMFLKAQEAENFSRDLKLNPLRALETTYEVPPRFIKQSKKLPYYVVELVIDVSGSTNNFGGSEGRFGCRGRGDSDSDSEDTAQPSATQPSADQPINPHIRTKAIILAEIECAIKVLEALAARYSFAGVRVKLSAFSSTHQNCFDKIVDSNEDLYDNLVCKLPELIDYQQGSTILAPTIKQIFDTSYLESSASSASSAGIAMYESKQQLIILATDGQASDQYAVKSEFESALKKGFVFDLICVGAGSIGSKASLNFASRRDRTSGQSERVEQLIRTIDESGCVSFEESCRSVSSSHGVSECDAAYLEQLTKYGYFGQYIGAYLRYQHVDNAIGQFVELRNAYQPARKLEYKVDTTQYNQQLRKFADIKTFTNLPPLVNQALQNEDYVVWRNKFGTYLLVAPKPTDCSTLFAASDAGKNSPASGFQIKLVDCAGMVQDEIVIVERAQIPLNLNQTYNHMFVSQLTQDCLIKFSSKQFQILGRCGDAPMCRQLIQV